MLNDARDELLCDFESNGNWCYSLIKVIFMRKYFYSRLNVIGLLQKPNKYKVFNLLRLMCVGILSFPESPYNFSIQKIIKWCNVTFFSHTTYFFSQKRNVFFITFSVIVIGVDGAWLYGIIKVRYLWINTEIKPFYWMNFVINEQEKPNFMLAKVIVAPIAIVIVVLAALFLALFGPSEEIIKVEGSEIVEEKVSPWPFAIALLIVGKSELRFF